MGSLRVLAGGVVLAAVSLLVPVEADAATAAISAKLSKTTIELGQSVAVTGTVTPSGATSRVVVQRSLGGGRWSDRAVGVVAPSGTFSVTIRPSGAGLYALRVRSGGGTVVSRNLFLKVKLGPAQAVRGVDWSRYAHPAALCADGFEAVAVAPPAFGDLTGDGIEEAAVPVTCFSGGSLYIPLLAVYGWKGGKPSYLTSWRPTDLPSDWPANIGRVSIGGRRVTVAGTYVPLGACHACSTASWSRRLVLRNGQLVSG